MARISPICDKIPDNLRVLALQRRQLLAVPITGSKFRTLVDDKITIIFWKRLVIDIWSSWHRLISGMKLA